LEVAHETLYFLTIAEKQGREFKHIEQQFNTTLTDSYNQSVHTAHELKAQLRRHKLQFDSVKVKFVRKDSKSTHRKRPLDIDQHIDSGPSPKLTCKLTGIEHKPIPLDYRIPHLTENSKEHSGFEQKSRKNTSTESLGKFIFIN
jgi:hypothetical protein